MTDNRPLLGAHMPTAGGVYKAIESGHAIGCDTVQVFTASPRQWRSPVLSDDAVSAYKSACVACGISVTIAHDSYLINLAAPPGDILDKSRIAFRGELDRAEALGIDYLVSHPGAHVGEGEEIAIPRIIASLDALHADTAGYHVKVAIETTAGQGSTLGYRFEQIAQMIAGVRDPDRLVVCVDTCHLFAAGYDIRDAQSYADTMGQFDQIIGRDKLAVVHANDSQKPLGSKVDRHAHIGEGEIGLEGFRLLVNDPRVAGLPIVVETPDAETMHEVNVKRLRDLLA
jgi:deoxyribonuclease-4